MFCVKVIHRLSSLENKGRTGIFSVFNLLQIFAYVLQIFAYVLQIFAYLATDFCLSCYRFIKYVAHYDKICRDICESLENKGVIGYSYRFYPPTCYRLM